MSTKIGVMTKLMPDNRVNTDWNFSCTLALAGYAEC